MTHNPTFTATYLFSPSPPVYLFSQTDRAGLMADVDPPLDQQGPFRSESSNRMYIMTTMRISSSA
jgi:hypothetical protein